MKRIEDQVTDSKELAKQVLSWITCAKRPLTTLELRHALAVEIDESEVDEDNLPEIEDMVAVCAGLVTVEGESDIIRLVHYTTQEFFERTQTSWFPGAEADIARICVTYLLFDAFEAGICLTDEEFGVRLRSNVLYDYAARNWGHHVRGASMEGEPLILDLLESDAKVSASCQVMASSWSNYSQTTLKSTGAHLAAHFGLTEAMAALLKGGHDPNMKDSFGHTPLSVAAVNMHEEVVKLLLATDGIHPDSTDSGGRTPLWWAAQNGHKEVVKLLLAIDDIDPNSKDNSSRTPLWCAAANGCEEAVKLLLAADGVKADFEDNDGRTPLSVAAENGHEAVMKLLLAMDSVDPNCRDHDGRTPLWWAAENGHEAEVKLLLETDSVNPNSRDKDGRTPIWWAAENGYETVVKLLLETDDIDPNSKDNDGRTPLWWAARNGHEEVVRLLLAMDGVDPDSKDNSCRTPLWCAAANGYEEVVKLLLVRDSVDANSRDNGGQTPLWKATENGHEAVIKLLLTTGGVNPEPLCAIDRIRPMTRNCYAISNRNCKASYGILCNEPYDKAKHALQSVRLRKNPIDGKQYAVDQICWLIRQGEPVEPLRVISQTLYRTLHQEFRHSWTDTIVWSKSPPDHLPRSIHDGDAEVIHKIESMLDSEVLSHGKEGMQKKHNRILGFKTGENYLKIKYAVEVHIDDTEVRYTTKFAGSTINPKQGIKVGWFGLEDGDMAHRSSSVRQVDDAWRNGFVAS